ncbi:molybdopterin-containing oxidoreductase III, DMSO/TMAO/BSO reductase family, catalytic subunit [Campylobacter blaseri]|uniref:Trimethylamine-N-oxide reductase n=1 Tax=Campylobacter blaseri TaxID=2042961 RepID=A0A2P8R3T1_9BACT|nr:molybdopterin-dependent oxidoreductase [Campylobacter blaseri]PSM53148.1 trimethylamine-N-oxide reductase [Campylobacter blaseri]PSM54614.1 trimethylamine-N-oxide reductase [Campylobacter blaseri]QKF86910.1 molybdopterin-containing oxidoreductase III, DMSO/TMAO/BSO reductase family, catalytic subunit [Campylobacter blaseri]
MKRRDFLKLSALAGVGLQANKIEGIKQTIFDQKKVFCANRFGPYYNKVVSGQIVGVEPFFADKFPTTLNNAVPDKIQNESRVLYPCVRKSYLKNKGPKNPELRGEEEFVRVDWDTALDLAAKALKDNFDKYGAQSIYGECYWWGGIGKVSWGRATARRMLTILGGFVSEDGNYSYGAGHVLMPHIIGTIEPNEAPTRWEAIVKSAKTIVFWGTDPLVTNEIGIGSPTHDGYKYYTKLKKMNENGEKKIYAVDTYRNNTIRYLNSDFIGVIPGTDTAMMIGMCHYLYENKLYDEDFIKKCTVGFNKFKEYLLGEKDNIVKNLEWASKICGVDVKKLEELCISLAKNESIIMSGFAIQRQDHGEQSYWALITLASMLGHIGKEGCGFMTCDQGHKTSDGTFISPVLKGLSSIPSDEYTDENSPWVKNKNYVIPNSRMTDALLNPGSKMLRNGQEFILPHMRVAFSACGSIFTRHQEINKTIEAWKKLDTVITAEPYWTSGAKLSDIVFPVAIEGERDDIDQSNGTGEYIFAIKKAVEPMGESRSDFEICREICKRWGMEEVFTEGKTEMEWIKEIFKDAMEQAKYLGYKDMPTFEEFWENGYIKFDKPEEEKKYFTRFSNFRKNPRKHRLGTPSGRIEIYSPVIAKMGYDDCYGHPTWFEPIEWLGNKEMTKKYPLALNTPHPRLRLHSQLNNSLVRNYAEVNGREPIIISESAAKKRNIKTGDIVRVFNDRGEILCGAMVSDITQDDVVIVCEGAWYDPEIWGKKSLCQHGCVNVLTKDKGTSKLAQSNIAHTNLVEVEKYKGVIRAIKAFSKPKILNA